MTEGKYSALTVALYIIFSTNNPKEPFAQDNSVFTTNLRLQKILYFVQAFFLRKTGNPAFYEDIEAWEFGPVVPNVHREFASYGNLRIYIEPEDGERAAKEISAQDKSLIDDVVKECSKYSISELMEMTHRLMVWREACYCYDQTIPKERILEQVTR